MLSLDHTVLHYQLYLAIQCYPTVFIHYSDRAHLLLAQVLYSIELVRISCTPSSQHPMLIHSLASSTRCYEPTALHSSHRILIVASAYTVHSGTLSTCSS